MQTTVGRCKKENVSSTLMMSIFWEKWLLFYNIIS
jgi:hypothetical protein